MNLRISLLERWTKLADAVLAHGVATEAHIDEMTPLARSEQDYIKRKLRRTAKVFRQSHRSISESLTAFDEGCLTIFVPQEVRDCPA